MTASTMNGRLWLAASSLALGAALIATPAAAQDATGASTAENAQDAAKPEQDDAIVVTGFRRALENAINKKKYSEQIVESVSAEDIGKLPDASIAESIARLPGLTSQRLSGRSNNISIRGFAPDFSTTLLNGREQTSTGDNRAVEFDQYPSEIINRVDVYKTPMASVIGQGLSGTVDMRTIRPLDTKKRVIAIGARGSYADLGKLNAGSDDKGYRINGLFVDQNDAGTLGVALGASWVDEPYQIEEFNAWGYPNVTNNGPVVIGGSKSYITSTQLTRLGLNGTLQFRPDPRFTSTLDAFYSDFKDDQIKRGIELPLFWSAAQLQPGFTVADGLVTSGRYTGVKGVIRNDAFQRKAKLYSFGWNNRFEGDNGFNLTGDISYSRTKRNELNVETYAGTGRAAAGASDTISFTSGKNGTVFKPTLNYGDFNTILLTSPQGWGGNQTDANGLRIVGSQDGYYNNRIVNDEIWQGRAEAEKEFTDSFLKSVQLGLNYTDRSKSLRPDEYFLGLKANTNGTTSVAVPVDARVGTSDLGFLGLGPLISYDPLKLVNSGIYNLVRNVYPDVVAKNYSISEKVWTPYLQVNIKSMVGASELTGNIGVQANHTDQSSNGTRATLLGFNANGSPNVTSTRNTDGDTYWDVLPSANLSLRMPGDFVVRIGAAREIIRPRLVDLRNSFDYGVSNSDPGDPARFTCPTGRVCRTVTGNLGNPSLRPFRANAVDVTFEKYFGTKGYLALQGFYKDLQSYIYKLDSPYNYTGFTFANPGTDNNNLPIIINPFGRVNQPINGKGGKLYGIEAAGTLPFDTFVSVLQGFGVTGSVSYTKTKVSPAPGAPATDLPGYSRWVANGTAYYENNGFSLRASARHRSSFIGEVTGFGGERFNRRARPETIIDGQVGYDFGQTGTLSGLSLFLQGQNLTNEPFATVNPNADNQVIDYQRYGRRFLAGFNYRF
ncbi:TonB-dependent receptor [Sphingomonas humi]|uniref:TonB-dependent receptor n=1 Tax=Sphingomonas humi TaxID=335630 RepID=A0ABP7RCS8_9SPHN